MPRSSHLRALPWVLLGLLAQCLSVDAASIPQAEIRTPAPPTYPRVTGPDVFGVRPGHPFLYTIPVTGERPMLYAVEYLPDGLAVDKHTGMITGSIADAGEHTVVLRASNAHGTAEKHFKIVVGDTVGLTPPLGWNSWNCWAGAVDQDKVLRSAHAFVDAGLREHGWTYINIDDTWQAPVRGGEFHAIQPNEKFPDMKGLVDEIHVLGLKAGIYSTPWETSYAGYIGGSADNPEGTWEKPARRSDGYRLGQYTFETNDARQYAAWGFDYLKYDWRPNDLPHTRAMYEALRDSGRDIFFSLSNSAPYDHIAELAPWANAWRTTGDITDAWEPPPPRQWENTVTEIGFNQDKWVPYGSPGHWNDPDMLVVGWVGWGPNLHPTRLTRAEQYSHISLWALLSAPMLIGCDLDRLDDFTLNLLTNDEVLAINQDALGETARRVATLGPVDVFLKPMADGSQAFGFFNRGDTTKTVPVYPPGWGLKPPLLIRDVWHQTDLGLFPSQIEVTVPPHDVVLYRAWPQDKPRDLGRNDPHFQIPATNDGFPGVGPVRRYDWFRNLWYDRRSKWARTAAHDHGAVVLLGDSITQGYEEFPPNHPPYPGYHVVNRAISGDTTRGILARLSEDVLSLDPRAVILLAGTNDLEEGADPEPIAANLDLIIRTLSAHDPHMPIIVCKVMPSSAQKKRPADKIKRINALLEDNVASNPQVTLVDTWTMYATPEGDAPPDLFPDLLHPNHKGYQPMIAAVRKALATAGVKPSPPDPGVTVTPDKPGYVLTFADEFDGDHLDTETWIRRYKWGEAGINEELQGYADDAFAVEDGILTIIGSKQPTTYAGEPFEYRSGVICSKHEQRYGYFEIRCKMPAGRGFWPAFWLLGPDVNQISIQEFLGQEPNKVFTGLHWGTNYATDNHGDGHTFVGPDFTKDFHTFAVDWDADRVIWYVDGTEVFRHEGEGVPQVSATIIANLGIGGKWPGAPDATTEFPGKYQIDYIRAYRHSER